jgi:hypothetical protein
LEFSTLLFEKSALLSAFMPIKIEKERLDVESAGILALFCSNFYAR